MSRGRGFIQSGKYQVAINVGIYKITQVSRRGFHTIYDSFVLVVTCAVTKQFQFQLRSSLLTYQSINDQYATSEIRAS